jgi:putative transposase
LPKADWIKELGDIKNAWPMFGIPMEVVFDNGMDLHSEAVALICYEMGTRVSFCPTGEPYFKGAIERMFGTLNTGLIHQLPGTTFSNTEERGDYPSEKKAVFTLAQTTQAIAMWIVDIYHQRRHRSTGETPQVRWNRQLGFVSIEFPAHPEQLDVLVGIPAVRQKITHEGILFDTIHYNNSDLQYLSQRIGRKKGVQFKYFEDDVGYIQVYDEERSEYIRVEAVAKYAEYANGLSRQLHLVTRRWAEKTYGADWKDADLIGARKRIENLVKQATTSKKMADRKKSAISRGINSDKATEDFSPLETAMSPRPDIRNFAPEFADPLGSQTLPVFGINRVPPTSNDQTNHAA